MVYNIDDCILVSKRETSMENAIKELVIKFEITDEVILTNTWELR